MMMWLIQTEFWKMKRYNVLWLGIVSLLFSIALAAFQLTGTNNSVVTYGGLSEGVVWNHFSLFLPFTFVLLTGYFINREYTDMTMKSMLTVPVSQFQLILGKLIVGYVVALMGVAFSFGVTLLVGLLLRCPDISLNLCIISIKEIFIVSSCSYAAVLPIIIIATKKQDKFLSGAAFAFVYGFCGIFAANGPLINFYPAAIGLVLADYPHEERIPYRPMTGGLVLVVLLIFSMILLKVFCRKKRR